MNRVKTTEPASEKNSPDSSVNRCPYCGSNSRQVKAGTNNGVQRRKCGDCKRRYTPLAEGAGYTDAVRSEAIRLRAEGQGLREIARTLGVNHQSVANWLHRQPAEAAAEEAVPMTPLVTGKPRPTIRDVAAHANVSASSVSNFLNQKGRMADVTRQRIQTAMEELHFTPSALVRAIKQRRTHILGVMIDALDRLNDAEGPGSFLIPALLRGINDGADAANNDLLLYTGGGRRHQDDLEARLLGGHIDGLIWMIPGKRLPLLKRVVASGLPVVALMTHEVPEGVHYVVTDNIGGMQQLVRHLAEQGHRRIAFVGPDWVSDYRDRHVGYRQAIATLGLDYDPALQVVIEQDRKEFSRDDSRNLLDVWLALPSPPTAILCGSDYLAAQFAETIRLRNLRIPEDIALAGFDDLPFAEHVAGGLTTIRQPFRQMGQLAAESLLALIDGKPAQTSGTVLPLDLIVRASTHFDRK